MFIGFPARVEWHRAALSREELLQVRSIDDRESDDYWVRLSSPTHIGAHPLDLEPERSRRIILALAVGPTAFSGLPCLGA